MTINRREFFCISACSSVALFNLVNSNTAFADHRCFKSFENWAGNIKFSPLFLYSPNSQKELLSNIKDKAGVKIVGGGLSFSPLIKTKQTLVLTKDLKKKFDLKKGPEKNTFWIPSHLTLGKISKVLSAAGYCIPHLPTSIYPTLGGTLSTGTHGSGLNYGSLADSKFVRGVRILRQDGSIQELLEKNQDHKNLLKAVRVSLGCVGYIKEILIKVEKITNIELITKKVPVELCFNETLLKQNDHFEFWYLPFTKTAYVLKRNKTNKEKNVNDAAHWLEELFIENTVLPTAIKLAGLKKSKIPKLMNTILGAVGEKSTIEASDKSLMNPRYFKAYDMEYCLPFENSLQALKDYELLVEELHQKRIFSAHLPAHIRFTRADQGSFLSPSQNRINCYFDLSSLRKFEGFEIFFREAEKLFLAYGGKPHWGKIHYQNPLNLYQNELSEFLKYRDQLDPLGTYKGDYLKSLLKSR